MRIGRRSGPVSFFSLAGAVLALGVLPATGGGLVSAAQAATIAPSAPVTAEARREPVRHPTPRPGRDGTSTAKPAPAPALARRPAPRTPAPKPRTPAPKGPAWGPWDKAVASWYGEPQELAGGGYLRPGMMIVAHKSLPFGTKIQFTYAGKSAVAVVKDRGPYIAGREFDLGPGVRDALGFDGVDTVGYRIMK